MNIILTDISNLGIFVIPVVPDGTAIKTSSDNEIIDTLDGQINIIGNEKLRKLEWDSFFPVNKHYSFVSNGSLSNGWLYVSFIESMKKLKLPIRVICMAKNKIPMANMLMSIDTFDYYIDKPNDIKYSISLTEFPSKFWGYMTPIAGINKYTKAVQQNRIANEALKKTGLL